MSPAWQFCIVTRANELASNSCIIELPSHTTAMFSFQDVSSVLNDNPLNYGLSAVMLFLAWPLLSAILWPSTPKGVEHIPSTPTHYSWLVHLLVQASSNLS